MKSFIATAFCLVSTVFAQCEQLPEIDLDFYAILDIRRFSRLPEKQPQIAEGVRDIVSWYAENGLEVYGSTGRAGPAGCGSCLHVYNQNYGGKYAAQLIEENEIQGGCKEADDWQATLFNAMVYRMMTFWSEPARKSINRRITFTITGSMPMASETAFNINWLRSADAACPHMTYSTLAQQKLAIERTKTAYAVIVLANKGDDAEQLYSAWDAHLKKLEVTDITVRREPENFRTEIVDVLKQLSCPSWVASTTSSNPRYSTTDRYDCFINIENRCDQERGSEELAQCLAKIDLRMALEDEMSRRQ